MPRAQHTYNMDQLLFLLCRAALPPCTDPTGSCVGACRERYVEILVLLCTLGLLICYYAITVGFLQVGLEWSPSGERNFLVRHHSCHGP